MAATAPRRALNGVVSVLVRAGVGPFDTWLLTVPGRRSGRPYTTPVSLVAHEGERWLVAPFGERSWVRNARAAGRVELRRGRRRVEVAVTEVPVAERAGILRAYRERVPLVGRFFGAPRNAPETAYAAEAARHPVFRLDPQP